MILLHPFLGKDLPTASERRMIATASPGGRSSRRVGRGPHGA